MKSFATGEKFTLTYAVACRHWVLRVTESLNSGLLKFDNNQIFIRLEFKSSEISSESLGHQNFDIVTSLRNSQKVEIHRKYISPAEDNRKKTYQR